MDLYKRDYYTSRGRFISYSTYDKYFGSGMPTKYGYRICTSLCVLLIVLLFLSLRTFNHVEYGDTSYISVNDETNTLSFKDKQDIIQALNIFYKDSEGLPISIYIGYSSDIKDFDSFKDFIEAMYYKDSMDENKMLIGICLDNIYSSHIKLGSVHETSNLYYLNDIATSDILCYHISMNNDSLAMGLQYFLDEINKGTLISISDYITLPSMIILVAIFFSIILLMGYAKDYISDLNAYKYFSKNPNLTVSKLVYSSYPSCGGLNYDFKEICSHYDTSLLRSK